MPRIYFSLSASLGARSILEKAPAYAMQQVGETKPEAIRRSLERVLEKNGSTLFTWKLDWMTGDRVSEHWSGTICNRRPSIGGGHAVEGEISAFFDR